MVNLNFLWLELISVCKQNNTQLKMPRSTRKVNKSDGDLNKTRHEEHTQMNSSVVNVNNSHSVTRNLRKDDSSQVKGQTKVKSKVIIPKSSRKTERRNSSASNAADDKVEFEEDGETIQMEINDGGVNEFSSEEQDKTENESSEEISDSDQSEKDDSETEAESGEVGSETEGKNSTCYSSLENVTSPAPKKKKKKLTRKSMEDQLSTMSSTLLAVKELLIKNRITDIPGDKSDKPARTAEQPKKGNLIESTVEQTSSETTIYKNVLDQVEDAVIVDQEISFKPRILGTLG